MSHNRRLNPSRTALLARRRARTNDYLTVDQDGLIEFKPKAIINAASVFPGGSVSNASLAVSSPLRDAGPALNTTEEIILQELQIVYPGGETSGSFPFDDLVLEWRDDIGVARTHADKMTGEPFSSAYMVDYCSVGISKPCYDWLVEKARPLTGGVQRLFPRLTHENGYVWFYAKLSKFWPVESYGLSPDDSELPVDNLADTLKRLGTNVIGCGGFNLRLKRRQTDYHLGPNQFELSATLRHFQPIESTTIRSLQGY